MSLPEDFPEGDSIRGQVNPWAQNKVQKNICQNREERKKLPHVYDKQFIIFDIKIRYKTYVIFYLLGVRVGLGAFLGTIT